MGKAGRPKRPRSEAIAFGGLIEAERTAGARTLGEAMLRARRRDPARWGSQRKMEALWAEYKRAKQEEKKLARLLAEFAARLEAFGRETEPLRKQLEAFERKMAPLRQQFEAMRDKIESEFVRKNPHVAAWLNRLRRTPP